MKKTPKDLATSPILASLNAIVAATALTGIASKSTPTVNASESSYDVMQQKSTGFVNTDMTSYNTVATQSYIGFNGQYGVDDSRTTTDPY